MFVFRMNFNNGIDLYNSSTVTTQTLGEQYPIAK